MQLYFNNIIIVMQHSACLPGVSRQTGVTNIHKNMLSISHSLEKSIYMRHMQSFPLSDDIVSNIKAST